LAVEVEEEAVEGVVVGGEGAGGEGVPEVHLGRGVVAGEGGGEGLLGSVGGVAAR
jgi:hypothetical protein